VLFDPGFQKIPINLPDNVPLCRIPVLMRALDANRTPRQTGKVGDFKGSVSNFIGSDNQ
jgi:hypothetical protein